MIDTEDGGRWTCRWLVTAVGCLSSANVPDIPGLDAFDGEWYQTGQWPHEGVDLAGRRVGVIGTGSTGIQAIPVLAETAGHLTVFQRTANFAIPARNAPLDPEEAAGYKDDYDAIREPSRRPPTGIPSSSATSTPSPCPTTSGAPSSSGPGSTAACASGRPSRRADRPRGQRGRPPTSSARRSARP